MMREPCPWRAAVARAARGAATAAALGAMISGCSGVTEVSTLELEGVVARDGVPFAAQPIPTEFLDRLYVIPICHFLFGCDHAMH